MDATQISGSSNSSESKPERLLSLDVLRGFDMLWITGGGGLIFALKGASGWGFFEVLGNQLRHVEWAGFVFYDLIFPLFMFISGVAIPYAIISKIQNGIPRQVLYKKIIRRLIALVLLGFIYNGFFKLEFAEFRFASVLGQIGFAYFFASLIVIHTQSFRWIAIWCGSILIGLGIIQLAVPVPGFGAGILTPEGSINGYIDRLLLPGRLYDGTFDPEGILCILSATGITLIGVIAGMFLRNEKYSEYRKLILLAATGFGLFILGFILKGWYPVIKKAWTSTFNLYAGGISFLLLALFYFIIEIRKYRKWAFFFQVIGVNSITIYIGASIISFSHTSRFFLGGLAKHTGDFGPVILSLGYIGCAWLFLYILFRSKIFLRV